MSHNTKWGLFKTVVCIMKIYFILLLLFLANISYAQDTTQKKKLQYFGIHQVSLLAGSSGEKIGVLTTNGVRFGNWHTGISTGIDWYGIRSFPLLASVHKAFGKAQHQPFIYGSAGIEFPWMEDYTVSFGNGQTTYDFRNGKSGEAGVGYFINLKNKTALSLSAGFSYKEMQMHEEGGIGGFAGNIPVNRYYKYYYRRIAIRVGIKI
jgi:hypothetical protein